MYRLFLVVRRPITVIIICVQRHYISALTFIMSCSFHICSSTWRENAISYTFLITKKQTNLIALPSVYSVKYQFSLVSVFPSSVCFLPIFTGKGRIV